MEKKKQFSSFVKREEKVYEMIYSPDDGDTFFLTLEKNGEEKLYNYLEQGKTGRTYPYPPNHDLVKNKVILFPSEVEAYGTGKLLIEDIRKFVHKYLEISPFFERLIPFYVLFTWLYDNFKELPYLRAIGDYGCGKSRFLRVVGSICYKPMFTVGATTTAPIFRIIDQFRGTLVLDEADLRFSDTNVDIVKILNNGFQDGMPVLRCSDGKSNHEVKAFSVFCPKIVATRNRFADKALESRFLIEYMDGRLTRKDIPLNLGEEFEKEALVIRNKCLLWRLKKYGQVKPSESILDYSIEPRLRQIASPLCAVIDDDEVKRELISFIKDYNKDLITDRGLSFEAPILEAIIGLVNEDEGDITMKAIAERRNATLIGEKELSSRRIGSIVRDKFRLKTIKKSVGYVLDKINYDEQIDRLSGKYGIDYEQVNIVNVVQEEKGDSKQEIEGLISKELPEF